MDGACRGKNGPLCPGRGEFCYGGQPQRPPRCETDWKGHKSLALKAWPVLVSPTIDWGGSIIVSAQRRKLDIVPIPAPSATHTASLKNVMGEEKESLCKCKSYRQRSNYVLKGSHLETIECLRCASKEYRAGVGQWVGVSVKQDWQ